MENIANSMFAQQLTQYSPSRKLNQRNNRISCNIADCSTCRFELILDFVLPPHLFSDFFLLLYFRILSE